METTFTKSAAVKWMVFAIGDGSEGEFVDCGEAQLTKLAEACADAFEANDLDGPLDDETHWIWDAPIEAARITGTDF